MSAGNHYAEESLLPARYMCILKSIGGSFSQRLSFLIQPIDERFDMPHFYSGAWYSKVVTQPESQCDGVICVRREFEVV